MAKLLHCCERHASRLFQEVCGTGFLTYVSELRLKKSCHLLLQSRLKIIDIALESGYGSLAHFNYAFKKRFGTTPTGWRERNTPTQRHTTRRKTLQVAAALVLWLTCWLANAPGNPGRLFHINANQSAPGHAAVCQGVS
jgi:AraC-like DNA-binding protein